MLRGKQRFELGCWVDSRKAAEAEDARNGTSDAVSLWFANYAKACVREEIVHGEKQRVYWLPRYLKSSDEMLPE